MDIFKNIIFWSNINYNEKTKILSRPMLDTNKSVTNTVQKIISDVKLLGDAALYKYTHQFDKIKLDKIKVDKKNITVANLYVSEKLKKAIKIAKKNITTFHKAQLTNLLIDINTQKGIRCEQLSTSINSVGIYIPGGSAPLISTVLMLAIPAYLAGCNKIVLCSPPVINNEILYAANICHITEIYQIGGAQAIAALAYGTETIPKVNKIFGPGNIFVTEAKSQVNSLFNGTSIDMLAGPSELMIIADETANAEFVASDLISQAEHGVDSQVFLLSTNKIFINKVCSSLQRQIKKTSRINIISKSLQHSYFIITESIEESIKIINTYAPEHLSVQIKEPRSILKKITNAGSIFLGKWSPESVGDYASGTNHVLPTSGYAKSQSSLGVKDFQKIITVQELTADGLLNIASTVENLATAENLDGHKNSVRIRKKYIKGKYDV